MVNFRRSPRRGDNEPLRPGLNDKSLQTIASNIRPKQQIEHCCLRLSFLVTIYW